MNPNARYITAEVLLNDEEKESALAVCRALGIGLSTWYRALGNEAVRTHRSPPAPPKEPGGCRGIGKPASRGAGFMARRRV